MSISRLFNIVVASVAAAVVAACGSDDEFVIECEIEGLGTGQVEMVYYDGAVSKVTAHGVDDKVTLRGRSAEPAIVTAFTIDRRELFTVVSRNGDEIEVKMKLDDPLQAEIKGNEPSEQLAAFNRENAATLAGGSREAINELVASTVRKNPDRLSTTAILMTRFDFSDAPGRGDSLLTLISPEARSLTMTRNFTLLLAARNSFNKSNIVRPITVYIGRDSLVNFVPHRQSYGLIYVGEGRKTDSLRTTLRALRKDFPARRLEILEVSVASDSAQWRRDIAADTARWHQGWVTGGVANTAVRNLGVSRVPLFIAVDSAGRQVYRGSSVAKADSTLRSRLGGK